MRLGLREFMFLLLLVAIPTAAWWLVFKPANEQIAAARAEILAKQQKLTRLEAATRHIEDLGREIDKLTQAIDLFEAKLPAEKEVEVILKEVWQVAARHQLKPRSIRAEKPIKSLRYSELPLKMVISGDFPGFYAFLLDLERLSRLTRIPDMKLEKVRTVTDGPDGQMEASFTLSIFFEPQSPQAQPPAASASTGL
jgi:type IV pilus assembly protein PilO